MKKRLLLSLTALVAFSASAQVKFDEQVELGTPKKIKVKREAVSQKSASVTGDNSYYYWSNNDRYTSELNTYLNDTPPAQGGTGFDSLGLYSYIVKQKTNSSSTYWQMLIQGIPTKADLSLNSLRYLGNALNSNGSTVNVSVYTKDLQTVLATKDVAFSTTYGWKTVTFDAPVTSNDTMLVVLTMKTAADSVAVSYSHNYFNGIDLGMGSAFQTDLPFVGDAAILAVAQNNASVLGLIKQNFDFFIVPNFSYDITANFSANTTTICEGEDVTFTNAGDTNNVYNPVLNYIAWDYLANGNAPAYTMYDYEGNSSLDYQEAQMGTYTYTTGNTYAAVASVITWPWSSSSMVSDDQTFTVLVNSKTLPTFTAVADFCAGTTAPALATSSNNSIAGTWSPATISNTTIGATTYTFTPTAGQCASNATLDVTVLDCAGINEASENTFTVYPNPANDVVTVSLKGANGTISLVAADGKVIETREVSSTTETFNVRSLNAGVYFIQLGQSVQKLMIK